MDPRWSSQFARKASRSSSVSGRLRAGRTKLGRALEHREMFGSFGDLWDGLHA